MPGLAAAKGKQTFPYIVTAYLSRWEPTHSLQGLEISLEAYAGSS